MTAPAVAARLDDLEEKVDALTRAVGCIGQALYQVNVHRTPLELRNAMDRWERHVAETTPPLKWNERRNGGPVTNASLDAEVARHAR